MYSNFPRSIASILLIKKQEVGEANNFILYVSSIPFTPAHEKTFSLR
jgi:hypothetical protein